MHWKGWAKKDSTWEPQQHLFRHAADLLLSFDARADAQARTRKATTQQPRPLTEELAASSSQEGSQSQGRAQRAADRGQRLFNDSSQKGGINAVLPIKRSDSLDSKASDVTPTIKLECAVERFWLQRQLLDPAPPIAKALVAGVPHLLQRIGPIGEPDYRWVDSRFFTPDERERAEALPMAPVFSRLHRPHQDATPRRQVVVAAAPILARGREDVWRPFDAGATPDPRLLCV